MQKPNRTLLKKSENIEDEAIKNDDFVSVISRFLGWIIIIMILIYYSVFRFQFIPINLNDIDFPPWIEPIKKFIIVNDKNIYGTNLSKKYIPFLQARVIRFQLFESGKKSPRMSERNYSKVFSSKYTHYINWELGLEHPKKQKQPTFNLTYRYYNQNEKLIFNKSINVTLTSGKKSSFFSTGIGFKNANQWKPGKYRIELLIKNKIVAKQYFIITR